MRRHTPLFLLLSLSLVACPEAADEPVVVEECDACDGDCVIEQFRVLSASHVEGPVDYSQESQEDEKPPAPKPRRPTPPPAAARRPAPQAPAAKKRKAPPSPIDLTAEDSDGGSGAPAAWTCARCTLVNSGGDVCNACAAPRNAGAQEEADAALARRLQEGQAPRSEPFDPCKPSLNGSSMARPAKK